MFGFGLKSSSAVRCTIWICKTY